ncbi:competence protein CoiA [Acinetobacter sp. YH12153]|uniref:competence protein CoiA n=1 Tax=Acinetobacter sp. YH12153 TaxID=2601133 RepID=UPI0015D45CAE|nr:competence protein CoiA family protein [Acinetobacter sp. YH12153]
MAFSAIINGDRIYSFKFSDEDWTELKKSKSEILMPCCQGGGLLKNSKLGTKFFSHKAKVNCGYSAPETIEHQFCKYLVAKTLHELGWMVETEKSGVTPSGKKWIADIYAEKGSKKICIEIQWSNQNIEDTRERHDIYLESGIKCLWLMRVSKNKLNYSFEISDVMKHYNNVSNMLYLKKEEENSFIVGGFREYSFNERALDWEYQSLELTECLNHLFSQNTISKVYPGKMKQYFRFYYAESRCWKCHQPTSIVPGIDIAIAKKGKFININKVSLEEINSDAVVDFINSHAQKFNFGQIAYRYSKTEGEEYLSNGCVHCDQLQGKYFLKHELANKKKHYSEYAELDEPISKNPDTNFWLMVK